MPIQNVFPAYPQHAINVVVVGREPAVGNLEGALNSKLLPVNFKHFADFVTQSTEEGLLAGVVDDCAKRPHESVLEDHVEPLRDLVGLHGRLM